MSAPVYSAWRPVKATPTTVSEGGNGQSDGEEPGQGRYELVGGGGGASIGVDSAGCASAEEVIQSAPKRSGVGALIIGSCDCQWRR